MAQQRTESELAKVENLSACMCSPVPSGVDPEGSDAPAPQPHGTPLGRPALCLTHPLPNPVQLPHPTHTMHVDVTNLCLAAGAGADGAAAPLLLVCPHRM
jgi:hypothetical protein